MTHIIDNSVSPGETARVTLKRQAQIANTISIASLLAIAGVGLWGVEGTPPARAVRVASAAGMEPVSLVDAPTLGNPSAPLALVMFSDFQCPYCRAFARATLPVVIERYVRPGKLLLAFKHFPLDIHGDARRAAELADCARRKARFWELHDAIFRDTAGFEGDWLTRVATMAGMPPAFFADCPFSAAAERVNQDVAVRCGPRHIVDAHHPDRSCYRRRHRKGHEGA